MVDVLWLAGTEQRLEQRIGEHAVVEGLLETVDRLLTAGELEEGRHSPSLAPLDEMGLARTTSPCQHALMRSRSATTFGRDAELRQLLELAELARSGSATSVLVHGEAGIGKTRLVSDLTADLRERDDLVVVGHGVHLSEGEVPFGVLTESLRDLVRSVGVGRVREVLGQDAEHLAPLVPSLRDGAHVDADRARIISATADLVEVLARDRLVCWVVEDLQWADTGTRDVFAYVARSLTSVRLLLVATWRDEDDGALRPDDPTDTVSLRGLDGPTWLHWWPRWPRASPPATVSAWPS